MVSLSPKLQGLKYSLENFRNKVLLRFTTVTVPSAWRKFIFICCLGWEAPPATQHTNSAHSCQQTGVAPKVTLYFTAHAAKHTSSDAANSGKEKTQDAEKRIHLQGQCCGMVGKAAAYSAGIPYGGQFKS